MTTTQQIDRVMKQLRVALETAHPRAVEQLDNEIVAFLHLATGKEAIAQPAFRKVVATVKTVVNSNASRRSIVETAPDKGAVRVIPTPKTKGGAK